MTEFNKIIKLVNKEGQAYVEKKFYDDFTDGMDEKVKNQKLLQREKNKIKRFAREVAAMAKCIIVAKEGRGLKYCAVKSRVSVTYLKSWIKKGEEAIEYCNNYEDDDGGIMDYQDHEDYIYIEFYLAYEEAKNEKINEREDIIDEQSKDLFDDEGNVLRTGSWKAAQYMLEVKDKEQYKEEQQFGGGMSENAGVVIINQPALTSTNAQDQAIELENIAKDSQTNFIEFQKEKVKEVN